MKSARSAIRADRKIANAFAIVQAYFAAEGKWLQFAEASISTCGIPAQVVDQLKQVHGRTEQAREKICSAAYR
jgi:hypothetical protein